MPYLIDGHNLIAHLPQIDMRSQTDEIELVILLRGHVAKHQRRIVVIFDHGLPGGASKYSNKAVEVVFASAGQNDADTILKERIRRTPDPRNWTLVSSDQGVIEVARQAGMKVQRSDAFARELQALGMKPRSEPGEWEKPQVRQKEIDELFEAFGGEPEAPAPRSNPPPQAPDARKRPGSESPGARLKHTPSGQLPADNDVESWLRLFEERKQEKKPEPPPLDLPKKKPQPTRKKERQDPPPMRHFKAVRLARKLGQPLPPAPPRKQKPKRVRSEDEPKPAFQPFDDIYEHFLRQSGEWEDDED